MSEQLALSLPARTDFSAASFVEGEANAEARTALAGWRAWPGARLALTGPAGAGKSHLAAIWAREAGAAILPAAGLAEALPSLEDGRALVIEDADRGADEDAFFHALNRAAEGTLTALLITGLTPPPSWPAQLPDLVSRLRAMPSVAVREPDDDMLAQVMRKQFADRQTPVGEGVLAYLLPRMERSVAAARALVEALDSRALAKQTPVTRTVAREVLEAWREGDSE